MAGRGWYDEPGTTDGTHIEAADAAEPARVLGALAGHLAAVADPSLGVTGSRVPAPLQGMGFGTSGGSRFGDAVLEANHAEGAELVAATVAATALSKVQNAAGAASPRYTTFEISCRHSMA